jgi:cyclophilin family peptidyl-prolyl cis-trans isomerase
MLPVLVSRRTAGLCAGLVTLLACVGCDRGGGSHQDPGSIGSLAGDAAAAAMASGTSALDALAGPVSLAVARAENLRRVRDLPQTAREAHDLPTRRLVARALARIGGDESTAGLLRALGDEDEETVAWAAYGLGYGCKGHEKERVAALAARLASLAPGTEGEAGTRASRDIPEVRVVLPRAVGQCGGDEADALLVGWLRDPVYAPGAALGLGDGVAAGRPLTEPVVAALLDAAGGGASTVPLDVAFYPLARMGAAAPLSPALGARLLTVARGALGRPGPYRLQAIRALRNAGPAALADLETAVTAPTSTPAEASEAARALGAMSAAPASGAAAEEALGRALLKLSAVASDPIAILSLAGDAFGPLDTVLHALRDPVPPSVNAALTQVTHLRPPGAPPSLSRRLGELRCTAGSLLARGAYDAEVVAGCAEEGSVARARGRLETLLRRPLLADRKTAYRALARDPHVTIREAALEAIGAHPELGDAATIALGDALADALDTTPTSPGGPSGPRVGLAAVAAKVLAEHPDRALSVSARERRAALDPSAPAPTPAGAPEMQVDPHVQARLEAALAFAWPPAAIETRSNLLDAATALHLPAAASAAERACRDPNPVIREHATKALRALGKTDPSCSPGDPPPLATELGHPSATPAPAMKLVFVTDAGELTVHLDPTLSPVAAAHYAELARSGIYKNTEVHRVVPGFVDQFGDPGADGYGGSGPTLRCETSPVPFDLLDVGVPLSGRDTGGSQIFVTLARTPHLDGAYARIGRAEGDWAALAEGDVIRDVRVQEE